MKSNQVMSEGTLRVAEDSLVTSVAWDAANFTRFSQSRSRLRSCPPLRAMPTLERFYRFDPRVDQASGVVQIKLPVVNLNRSPSTIRAERNTDCTNSRANGFYAEYHESSNASTRIEVVQALPAIFFMTRAEYWEREEPAWSKWHGRRYSIQMCISGPIHKSPLSAAEHTQ